MSQTKLGIRFNILTQYTRKEGLIPQNPVYSQIVLSQTANSKKTLLEIIKLTHIDFLSYRQCN